MEINLVVVMAVLLGALLHAFWNALIKSSSDKSLDTALIHGLGAVVAVPLLCVVGWPDAAAWPYIAATTVVHLGYYATLAAAYKHGDFGLTYPVMRGSAPLFVALASQALIGEALSWGTWMGILVICAGVLLIGVASQRSSDGGGARSNVRLALGFAMLNAMLIATYTIIDGLGVRASGNALSYVAVLFLFDAFPYLCMTLWGRTPAMRVQAWQYMAKRWPVAALGTLASLGSYGIALWAMTQAPVAVVAALRETSVLFAVAIGCLVLREKVSWHKLAGASTIVCGIWLLRLV